MSCHSGTVRHIASARGSGGPEGAVPPSAWMTWEPQRQPPAAIARAIASAPARSRSSNAVRSASNAPAAETSARASAARPAGADNPTALASPDEVGTTNAAGRTNANSSSRSSAGNGRTPRRRATAGAWHRIGGAIAAMRRPASARGISCAMPSASTITAVAAPTATAGAAIGGAKAARVVWRVMPHYIADRTPAIDPLGRRV
jgi:hypothetical protein